MKLQFSYKYLILAGFVFVSVGIFPTVKQEMSYNQKEAPFVTSVLLTENGFEPNEISVLLGSEVTFSTTLDKPFWPASNLHPQHTIYSQFDPMRPIESNESWSFVFNKEGTWNYHDHIRSYFTGTVYVIKE